MPEPHQARRKRICISYPGVWNRCERFGSQPVCIDKNKIVDNALLPAPAYKKGSETSSPVSLTIDPHASLTRVTLTATKPCGHIVKEDLEIIAFFDNATKTHYAVSSFMTPMLQQDDLFAIARGIHEIKFTGTTP